MILKKLILMVLLSLSVMADKIELTNILYIGTEMSQSEIVEKLQNIPNNTSVMWSSGSYELGKINLKNKKNIEFSFEKGVSLSSDGIYLTSCDNLKFSDFNYTNKYKTDQYFIIKDSSNIAILNIEFKRERSPTNGININNSQDIYLSNLNFKNGLEWHHLRIIKSRVSIDECTFYKDYNKYPIIYSKRSDINISNSIFSSEVIASIAVSNSRGVIQNNKFEGLLKKKNTELITAISIKEDSHFKLINNSINNYLRGIHVIDSEAFIGKNRIKNATYGIVIGSSKAIIESNILEDINNKNYLTNSLKFFGFYITDKSTVNINSNQISNTSCGISIFAKSKANIIGNTIHDIFKQGSYNEAMYIHSGATVAVKNNTIINTENKYDGKTQEYLNDKVLVDTDYSEIKLSKMSALKKSTVDYKAIVSGNLIEDLFIKNTIIDAGEYIKINKNSKTILFPNDYRGLSLNELPKLESKKDDLNINFEVKVENAKQWLYGAVQTHNTIESIKYKGKLAIRYEKKSDLKSGLDTYLFSIKLKDNAKERFFSFIAHDGRESIKKFVLDNGKVTVVEENDKRDF